MEQTLTMTEIEAKFASEWILLADPSVDEFGRVLSGVVASHSKDRDEVYREAIRLKLASSATLYTGRLPSDAAIIL